MIKMGFWNTRGPNDPLKQVEVRNLIRYSSLSLLGIVETHVQESNKDKIRRSIHPSWKFVDNYSMDGAGKIWVGWDTSIVKVQVIH